MKDYPKITPKEFSDEIKPPAPKFSYYFFALVSLLLVAAGLYFLWPVAHSSSDLAYCIVFLAAAPSISMAAYVFSLRDRIAALEKRQPEK